MEFRLFFITLHQFIIKRPKKTTNILIIKTNLS